ncbi:MAG TPA: NIPSNAP family protein [Cyclobacteriaceae bacterium]|nr:NIPSNAP family protein [Cyclobacteriaceae bacterium]
MKKLFTVFMITLFSTVLSSIEAKELYELRIYELTMGSLPTLEKYFTDALIPALNKHGVKSVGVFRETSKNEPALVYLLIPYSSFEDYERIHVALAKDPDYAKMSEAYNQVGVEKPVYFRYESSFMIAFDELPRMVVPENKPRIFELRTYQGYSDDAVRRKIKMFNEEEFDIFYRTKLNPVFFGEVISGKGLPALTYMITFKDMEERDNNWKAFSADPTWQKVSKDPQYANTVSRIVRVFLEPMTCSQI